MLRPSRAAGHGGGLLLEILVAFVLLVVVAIPLIGSFVTGVRQTRAIKSYVAAQCLAEAAVAQTRAAVSLGLQQAETLDMTQDLRTQFGPVAEQLADLSVQTVVEAKGTSGKCFLVTVTVRWQDKGLSDVREVMVRALDRGEL